MNGQRTIADAALFGLEEKEGVVEKATQVAYEKVSEEKAPDVKKEAEPKAEPVKVEAKETPKPAEAKAPEVEKVPEAESIPIKVQSQLSGKYLPGNYRSDRFLRVIKTISFQHTTDANGKIQRTHGTWVGNSNMIIFQKGKETTLTVEDLALPSIQRLIDGKVIYRLG